MFDRSDKRERRLSLHEANVIAERDAVPKCKSCSEPAQDNKEYCWYCEQYWNDVDEGLFSDFDDFDL